MKYIIIFCTLISVLFAANYHGCALAPDNLHGWVVRLDSTFILHTTDGGVTWQHQTPPAGSKRFFDVTCIDQFSAWTCADYAEILHTDNGGLDWIAQTIGLSKYATRIEMFNQNYGWVTCGDGTVGRTDNGGSFWEQNFTPWLSAEFYGVSFVNQWDGWIVAGYPDSMLTGQGIIAGSVDGGITWDSSYQVSSYEDFFDVHFFNLLDGVVVGGDESDDSPIILKTTNGGLIWNTVTAPPNTYYLRSVDFVDNEGWAVGKFGSIIHSTDAGDSWSTQNSSATNTLFDIDFSDHLHGIACGYDIILYTTDGGLNWHVTSIKEETRSTQSQMNTLEIYPNPFREITNIKFQIPDDWEAADNVELKIYDVTGSIIKSFSRIIPDTERPTLLSWAGTDNSGAPVSRGIYFVKLTTSAHTITKELILLR